MRNNNNNFFNSTSIISDQQQNVNVNQKEYYKLFINHIYIIGNESISYEEDNSIEGLTPPYNKSFSNTEFYKDYYEYYGLMGQDSFEQIPTLFFIRQIDNSLELIKQLKNGYLIYYQDNNIYINDQFNKNIDRIKKSQISLISELKNDKILIITKNMFYYIITLKEGFVDNKYIGRIKDYIKLTLLLEINENQYIISCSKNTFYCKGDIIYIMQNYLTNSSNEISKECYSQGTVIDNRILVLFNNKNLHIYDKLNDYAKIYEINNLPSINNKSLSVIHIGNNKIVLLGYKDSSFNGILTIKINLDNDDCSISHKYNYKELDIRDAFFCPLKQFKDLIINKNYNNLINDSNFILVFGDKIKVYKIVEEGNHHKSTVDIKFVCYIEIKEDIKEHFKDITSAIQLYGNTNIMIITKSGQKEFYLKLEKIFINEKNKKS